MKQIFLTLSIISSIISFVFIDNNRLWALFIAIWAVCFFIAINIKE